MTKPLYMEILSNERSKENKRLTLLSKVTFDSLDEAAKMTKEIARDHRVKISVRGRKGNLRYMVDGRR